MNYIFRLKQVQLQVIDTRKKFLGCLDYKGYKTIGKSDDGTNYNEPTHLFPKRESSAWGKLSHAIQYKLFDLNTGHNLTYSTAKSPI